MHPSPSHLPKKALLLAPGEGLHRLLFDVLAAEGWDVEQVPDYQTALAVARTNPFDLVIAGCNTYASEDLELLSKIRSSRAHLRLIILTNEWVPGDVIAALRAGAFSYFSAPFDAHTVAEVVRSAMAMAQPCWDEGIEILSATPAWISLSVRCDLDTADRLVHFLRQTRDPGIPEEQKNEIIMAFREILINAMEHGANFDPTQYVQISFVRGQRAFFCRVKDPGEGFSREELQHAANAYRAAALPMRSLHAWPFAKHEEYAPVGLA